MMRQYGKDYHKNGDRYEYTGAWYETPLRAAQLRKLTIVYSVELAVMTLFLLTGLCLNNVGSRVFWILLPFIAQFLPIIYGWMGNAVLYHTAKRFEEAEKAGNGRVLQAKRQEESRSEKAAGRSGRKPEPTAEIPPEHAHHLRRSDYEQGFRRMVRCSVSILSFALIALVANGIILVGYEGSILPAQEVIFAAATLGNCVIGFVYAVQGRRQNDQVKKLG